MNDQFYGRVMDQEDLAVSTTAVSLTAAKYKTTDRKARVAVIRVEAQPVRYTCNGTTPNNGATPPVGALHAAGNDPIVLFGEQALRDFRVLRSGASDAVIHVIYYA